MQKMPDSRGVPPKNGAGLYRAGVAELIRHIIRMVLMSTKTWCLLASAMGNGTMESGEVSHFEIYMIPLPLQEIMLLRPTSEIDQILYG